MMFHYERQPLTIFSHFHFKTRNLFPELFSRKEEQSKHSRIAPEFIFFFMAKSVLESSACLASYKGTDCESVMGGNHKPLSLISKIDPVS